MKISLLKIKDYIGIEELNWNPGNTNVIVGPKSSGKTTITEALEKTISNNQRRTEVIRHGADESLLFVAMDNGLEVDRRLRVDKSDYLKLAGDMVEKSTEGELRKFLAGDIFRPLDFLDLDIDKQTEIILSMIKMDYSPEQINGWFGEDVLSKINTSKHLLQILKDIESQRYKERTEVNREVRTLEAQVKGIEQELPANYDGEEWKSKKVQEYYDKVSKAQELSKRIGLAQSVINEIDQRIQIITAEAENDRSRTKEKYSNEKQDIKDLIQLKQEEIKKKDEEKTVITEKAVKEKADVDVWLNEEIQKLKEEAAEKKVVIDEQVNENFKEIAEEITNIKYQISAKIESLTGLAEKKELELQSISKETKQNIRRENEKVGLADKLLEENKDVDMEAKINKLQETADKVADMREHLHEWNRMVDIRDGKLAKKRNYSNQLTNLIEVARNKPSELLKQHKLPLEGISVDEDSMIRIKGTLLDGLSDGEALEISFKLALQRMGDLRVMCLDGFERLNDSEQEKIIRLCEDNEIQTFITRVEEMEGFEIIDETKQAEKCKECFHKFVEGEGHCHLYEKMLVGCKKFKPMTKPQKESN